MELRNKNVLITGGGKGIGRTVVDALVRDQAAVGVLDLDTDGISGLTADHPDVLCLCCDVTDCEAVEEAVNSFYSARGSIDVLINNAGILYSAPLVSLTPQGLRKHDFEQWKRVIDTNLNSLCYVTATVVEKMMADRVKGIIVNVSSVSAAGNPGQSAYSAAKAGVNALTATWAKELGMMGLRVVGVSPGFSDTPSAHAAISEPILRRIVSEIPLKRLGTADEVADAILFAIKNDYLNGKTIEIDGGLVV